MGIVITVMSGAEDGRVFKPDKLPIVLGRHPDDHVCLLYDTRVSRHHARISKEGASYSVEDVGAEGKGSSNGTYLNDKRITAKTPVSPGDMLLLGNVWVKIEAR